MTNFPSKLASTWYSIKVSAGGTFVLKLDIWYTRDWILYNLIVSITNYTWSISCKSEKKISLPSFSSKFSSKSPMSFSIIALGRSVKVRKGRHLKRLMLFLPKQGCVLQKPRQALEKRPLKFFIEQMFTAR